MGFDSEDDISDTETDVERATAVSVITIPSLIYLNTFSRLLCWTAQIIFPYLRTSFLTDFKTGWIACLKDQLIGLFLQTCEILQISDPCTRNLNDAFLVFL